MSRLTLFLSLVITVACTPIINAPFPATPDDVGPQEAVLYGRFQLAPWSKFMALAFQEVNTKKYVFIHLTEDKPIRMLRVPAGTYRLVGGVLKANAKPSYTHVGGTVQRIFENEGRIFEANPGRAYYVGEYHGSNRLTDIEREGNVTITTYGGNIEQTSPAFATTTKALLAHAPWLSAMQPAPAWDMGILSYETIEPDAPDSALAARVSLYGPSPAMNRVVMSFGMASGGDDVLSALALPVADQQRLSAGTQLRIEYAYERMLYWSRGYRHGVGLGLNLAGGISLAGSGDDDNEWSFIRLPVELSPHYLYRLKQHWYLLAGVGLGRHFASSLHRSDLDETRSLDPATALSARVGIYLDGKPMAYELSLRGELVSYTNGSVTVNGNNIGISLRWSITAWPF
ncbi:MAG: hypothetical protein OEY28_03055 [Nitrospira sp.]|nr:hypothetical protein [Nitrospira sp.]